MRGREGTARRRAAKRCSTCRRWRAALAASLAALAGCTGSSTAPRLTMPRRASLALAPSFASLPHGVPAVRLSRMRGVLVGATGDSIVADAPFRNHTAVLAFTVQFTGSTARFRVDLAAYDLAGTLAYRAVDTIDVLPGENAPTVHHPLHYAAPDSGVATIRVVPDPVVLQTGAGANLGVTGATRGGRAVTVPIRVGWLSRAESVATVDSTGEVHAGAAAGSTYVVATSASGAVDSALVRVHR